ncbi:MAG: ACT domain-containing protein [Phycisphaerae bacterium]|nr:ACT domain-containing protein [Phycisphaerae bacterium]
MSYTVKKVDVWAGDVMNRPEKLARVLEALTAAGAQLEFLVARRVSQNTSRIFVAPLKSKKERQAASDVGLVSAAGMHSIRIDGPDRAGLGADIARAVAAAGINVRGASAATIGKKNVFWLAFAESGEADAAIKIIKKKLAGKKK